MDETIQTRNEDGQICYWTSLEAAFKHAIDTDDTIWKISFNAANGDRVRLVRHLNVNGETIWLYQDLLEAVGKEMSDLTDKVKRFKNRNK